MKNFRLIGLIMAMLMLTLCVVGCAPKLEEEAATVAKDYYSHIIMRQDNVSAKSICAYDKIAITEAVYTNWAEKDGKTLEEYIASLAERRNMPADTNTTEKFLKVQSEIYVEKNKKTMGEDYFNSIPEVISFTKANSSKIDKVYNELMNRYGKDKIDFTQYVDIDDIAEARLVEVGVNDQVTEVLVVKVDGQWKYLA